MTRGRLARLGRAIFLPTPAMAGQVRLRSPADVLALLEAEAARIRADPTPTPSPGHGRWAAAPGWRWPSSRPTSWPPRGAALEAVLARRSPA